MYGENIQFLILSRGTVFERFTVKARRAIYSARNETSQLGAEMIASEHLLLGLLSADPTLIEQLLSSNDNVETFRKEIENITSKSSTKVPVSRELPLSEECQQILQKAAKSAEEFSDREIGTEHFLHGMLSVEKCMAAALLRRHEISESKVRRLLGSLHPDNFNAP